MTRTFLQYTVPDDQHTVLTMLAIPVMAQIPKANRILVNYRYLYLSLSTNHKQNLNSFFNS